MMPKIDMQQITGFMQEVGQTIIMPRWRNLQASEISQKTGPMDLVTIADKEAEAALTPMLKAVLPGSHVLGEESFAADPSLIDALRSEHPVWIVDPVDGTRPFAHGEETFGTIIALVQNDEILAGWIHHPITGDTLMTEKGAGAHMHGRRLAVAPFAAFADMFGILGVRLQMPVEKHPGTGQAPKFERKSFVACQVYPAMLTTQSLFGLPSEPQYHFRATASYSRPWDDAAGVLAIRESGGEVINWEGQPYRPTMFDNGTISASSAATALAVRDWLLPAYHAARA
jgi:fructose-1,6-bisphosphatase/inositol monophosphatase family enzyme